MKDATDTLPDNHAITDAQFDRLERILKSCLKNSAKHRKESKRELARVKEMEAQMKERQAKLKEMQEKTDRALELRDGKMGELRKRDPKH